MFQDWILSQFERFNVLMIIVMILFVTTMSKKKTSLIS